MIVTTENRAEIPAQLVKLVQCEAQAGTNGDEHMKNSSTSEAYGVGAALALLFLVLLDNAWAMLVVSVVGLLAGLWLARQGEVKRLVWVATAAFGVALVFALFALLR